MPWDATPNGGFSTGNAWFTLDPAYATGRNVAAASADPASTLTLVRDLACVRAGIEGAAWEPVATDSVSVLAFSRATEDGRVVVVANLGAVATREVRIDAHGAFRDLTDGFAGVYAADGLRVQGLPAYGYALFGDELAAECPVAGPA
jgi:glycosidase